MSREFVSGSSEYLETNNLILTSYNATFACWAKSSRTSGVQTLMSVGVSFSSVGNWRRLLLYQSAVQSQEFGNISAPLAKTSSNYSTSNNFHVCATFESGVEQKVYLNGGSSGTGSTSNFDYSKSLFASIGRNYNNSIPEYPDADVSEAAIWSVVLDAASIESLAAGVSPLLIRPDKLLAYWPIIGRNSPEIDLVGGYDLTVGGTPLASSHPRVIQPTAQIIPFPTGAADATAPVLSSPTGTKTGSTTADGTVSTDEGNGTLYYYASTSSSEVAADIKANGSNQAVSGTGSQAVSFTGLTASTTYYAHYVHDDAASNESNVQSSTSFTTDAAGASGLANPLYGPFGGPFVGAIG